MKRRWLAFSLRAVFVVVTVIACWLGHELHIIRSRQKMIVVFKAQFYGVFYASSDDRARIPTHRQWMGDRAVDMINIRGIVSQETIAEIQAAFPEAGLINRHTGG